MKTTDIPAEFEKMRSLEDDEVRGAVLSLLDYPAFVKIVKGMIKGVPIWVNFTQTEQGVLCELRSNRYNINPIAVKYGGGGHAKASGATVANKEIAMQMLCDLNALTKE